MSLPASDFRWHLNAYLQKPKVHQDRQMKDKIFYHTNTYVVLLHNHTLMGEEDHLLTRLSKKKIRVDICLKEPKTRRMTRNSSILEHGVHEMPK